MDVDSCGRRNSRHRHSPRLVWQVRRGAGQKWTLPLNIHCRKTERTRNDNVIETGRFGRSVGWLVGRLVGWSAGLCRKCGNSWWNWKWNWPTSVCCGHGCCNLMLPQAIGKSELNFNLCPALCSNVEHAMYGQAFWWLIGRQERNQIERIRLVAQPIGNTYTCSRSIRSRITTTTTTGMTDKLSIRCTRLLIKYVSAAQRYAQRTIGGF